MAHQELGVRLIERVKGDLAPYSTVEQYPKMEGRQLIMVLAPKKTKKPVAKTAVKAAVQKKAAASAKEAAPKVAAEAAAGIEKK
jgi:translation initiation factor IF-3